MYEARHALSSENRVSIRVEFGRIGPIVIMAFIEYQHSEVAEELFTGSFASVRLVPSDE